MFYTLIIIIVVFLCLKIFFKNFFFNFFKFFCFNSDNFKYILSYIKFYYKKFKIMSISYNILNLLKKYIVFFNFGSFKQSYFNSWWKNYKLKQDWIWKWRV